MMGEFAAVVESECLEVWLPGCQHLDNFVGDAVCLFCVQFGTPSECCHAVVEGEDESVVVFAHDEVSLKVSEDDGTPLCRL